MFPSAVHALQEKHSNAYGLNNTELQRLFEAHGSREQKRMYTHWNAGEQSGPLHTPLIGFEFGALESVIESLALGDCSVPFAVLSEALANTRDGRSNIPGIFCLMELKPVELKALFDAAGLRADALLASMGGMRSDVCVVPSMVKSLVLQLSPTSRPLMLASTRRQLLAAVLSSGDATREGLAAILGACEGELLGDKEWTGYVAGSTNAVLWQMFDWVFSWKEKEILAVEYNDNDTLVDNLYYF